MPSGLVYIDGKDWEAWKASMERLSGTFGLASDKTLAYIGAEGRRIIGAAEEAQGFEFGVAQKKWKKGRMVKSIRSRRSPSHGWYLTSIGTRMIGFSYENALSYQKRKMRRLNDTASQGYVYSLMANLWNNPTKPYSSNSPGFRREGASRTGGWARGTVRPARPALSAQKVQEGLSRALPRAEAELERLVRQEGF